MLCPRCGNELADGVRFCTSCGMPLTGELAGDSGEFVKAKSQNRKLGIIVVAAIAVIVIVLAVLIVKLVGGGSYEKPLDHLFRGIAEADAAEVAETFPKAIWDSDYLSMDEDEMIESLQERLDDLLDGTKVEIDYKVMEEEELSSRQVRTLTRDLQDAGLDIEEIQSAYTLRIQVSLESDDEDSVNIRDLADFLYSSANVRNGSFKEDVTVAKVDGDWCLVGGLMLP